MLSLICALATPPGRSAIAIIRISGNDCFQKISLIFEPAFFGKYLLQDSHRNALHGYLVEPSHLLFSKTDLNFYNANLEKYIIDEVIVIPFIFPNSYTGEEYIEIHCHGNPIIIERIFEVLYTLGMNLAMPGEFTKRAVLNQKILLYQADAIREIIDANSREHLQKAFLLKEGVFQSSILNFRSELLNTTTDWISELDFIDQDISFSKKEQKIVQVENLLFLLEDIIKHSVSISLYKKSYSLVITGETNTGKSSLFNYFLGHNRSIVSPIHGTTRDYIEGTLLIAGYQITCFDTAGIRSDTKDVIEKEGIRRSQIKQDEADILLFMIDGHTSFLENIRSKMQSNLLRSLLEKKHKWKQVICLVNKKDILDSSWDPFVEASSSLFSFKEELIHEFEKLTFIDEEKQNILKNIPFLFISVDKKEGLTDLFKIIERKISLLEPITDGIVFSAWQKELLLSAKEHLQHSLDLIQLSELPELIVATIQLAMRDIETIAGDVSTEDLLSRIFSRFCIGK